MNISPTLTICCTLIIIGSGMVAAQISQNPTYEQPVDKQLDDGSCHQKMVEALYEATDITDPAQTKHLLAADAYQRLDQAGQRCR